MSTARCAGCGRLFGVPTDDLMDAVTNGELLSCEVCR